MNRFYLWPWKAPVDDEVDDELTFHLEMRTREYIDRGFSTADARREAERRMGDVERVRAACRTLGEGRDRRMRRIEYASELRQDIGFAWRQMRRHPGFALVASLTLALGIGGTTAIFSAVDAVVLRPLPLRDPARLMVVAETWKGMPSDVSAGNFTDANAGITSFDGGLTAEQFSSFNLADGGTPERIIGGRVTANYFDVLGARPAMGRTFRADEDRPGDEQVVVLSHRLWMRRFGAASAILERDIRMNGRRYTVAGVMPASFDLTTNREEVWVPIAFTPERKALHDEHYLTVYGRLKADATVQRALAELEAVASRLRRDFPKDDGELTFTVIPFTDQFVGDYSGRSATCCSLHAGTSRTCCWRAAPRVDARLRSVPRSAPGSGALFGSFSRRAPCSRCARQRRGFCSRNGAWRPSSPGVRPACRVSSRRRSIRRRWASPWRLRS